MLLTPEFWGVLNLKNPENPILPWNPHFRFWIFGFFEFIGFPLDIFEDICKVSYVGYNSQCR